MTKNSLPFSVKFPSSFFSNYSCMMTVLCLYVAVGRARRRVFQFTLHRSRSLDTGLKSFIASLRLALRTALVGKLPWSLKNDNRNSAEKGCIARPVSMEN